MIDHIGQIALTAILTIILLVLIVPPLAHTEWCPEWFFGVMTIVFAIAVVVGIISAFTIIWTT